MILPNPNKEISSIPLSIIALNECDSKRDNTRLIVVQNTDTAGLLAKYIKSIKPSMGNNVIIFPEWDTEPKHHISPSVDIQAKRLSVLFKLINNPRSLIVITTPTAILQKVPPEEYLYDNSCVIKKDDEINLEQLKLQLINSGYNKVELVEDLGQFAVRGNIIDIFPPNYDDPLRLELFGDFVTGIKTYNTETQRSQQNQDKIFITPTREISLSRKSIEGFKINLKKYCDDNGTRKDIRDRATELVENGFSFPGIEFYLPFFFERLSAVFDYLPKDTQILTVDSFNFENSIDEILDNCKEETFVEDADELPPYPLNDFYSDKKTFFETVKSKSARAFYTIEYVEGDREIFSLKDSVRTQAELKSEILSQKKRGGEISKVIYNYHNKWVQQGLGIIYVCHTQTQAERLSYILNKVNPYSIIDTESELIDIIERTSGDKRTIIKICDLSEGFVSYELGLAIACEDEIFGPRKKAVEASSTQDKFFNNFNELDDGDFVVHNFHGIGIYRGLRKLKVDNVENDFFQIEYADKDILYVPVYRLNTVQRFVAKEGSSAHLDKLGGKTWLKKKSKARLATMDLAYHLIKLQSERLAQKGFAFSPPDEMFIQFESDFEYQETPDQVKSIRDVLKDMQESKPMDRLVCGDVGFGKTEVALRAAFKAVLDNKQVAVLVPTTILAFQHYQLFSRRLKNYPVKIDMLSRFKSRAEQNSSLIKLEKGELDIIIGTHRLISQDVRFSDLGLLIIDEEQHLGVKQKEKIKSLKANVDVLTLTATPIPRTLNFALLGLKDISVISTAPINRLPIRTYVARFSKELIRKAILNELKRGGQVFFLHNRVQDIPELYQQLKEIVPEARVIYAHGQMNEHELEEKMMKFYAREADVLLCTTIIESGVDVPIANTIIINRADMLGLSQLYQIRGRVGRSNVRAYCYMLIPNNFKISKEAEERINALQKFTELGSGFRIASHDLELRGSGELLGSSQSGFINDIGYEEYLNLLEESMHSLKGESIEKVPEPEISINVSAFIPESYIEDTSQRLFFYKKLSAAPDAASISDIEEELTDRYGSPPEEVKNLFSIISIKQHLGPLGVSSVKIGNNRLVYTFDKSTKAIPEKVVNLVLSRPNKYKITPDMKLISIIDDNNYRSAIDDIKGLITYIIEV